MKGRKYYLTAKDLHKKLYSLPIHAKETKRVKIYYRYFDFLRKAAYLGNTEAQYDLGQQYETMNSLNIRNLNYKPRKCIYWYRKACTQNHAEACNNLASFFETGEGCKMDLEKALSLYKKSAELGYSVGLKNYRIMKNQIAKLKRL